jgi:hypothetical protein
VNENSNCTRPTTLDWVLQEVKGFHHYMGLSCEELEKELVALFATIAAIHYQEEWASNSKLANRGKRELKNCHVLSIMILNVVALANAKLRGGFFRFFTKPKLLCGNIRELNEGDKRLRIINLLKEWKVGAIYLQQTKLEHMPCSVLHSLWGCHHVDWCCLHSKGVSMKFCSYGIAGWWKTSKSMWGNLLLLALLEISKINLLGLLRVFMVLILIVMKVFMGCIGWFA